MQIAITGKDLNLATLDSNEAKRPGLPIWEHSLSSGKKYLFGVFGIGSESYRIENKRTGWTAEEKTEIDNRQAEDQRVIDEAIRKKREQATQRAASMWDSVATQHSVAADHPYVQKKKNQTRRSSPVRRKHLNPVK